MTSPTEAPRTDPRTCAHPVIETWRYVDGPESVHGEVAMWACRDCRTRFSPGKQHPIPLPQPSMLGLSAAPASPDVARAVAIIEGSRQTHVHWAEWRRKGGTGDDMAGDLEHHEQAIRDYDHVLSVLRALPAAPEMAQIDDALQYAIAFMNDPEGLASSREEWRDKARAALHTLRSLPAAAPAPLDRLTDPAWLSDEMGMHQFVNDRQCDCGDWDAFHDKGTFNDHLANEIIAAARKPATTPPTDEIQEEA